MTSSFSCFIHSSFSFHYNGWGTKEAWMKWKEGRNEEHEIFFHLMILTVCKVREGDEWRKKRALHLPSFIHSFLSLHLPSSLFFVVLFRLISMEWGTNELSETKNKRQQHNSDCLTAAVGCWCVVLFVWAYFTLPSLFSFTSVHCK